MSEICVYCGKPAEGNYSIHDAPEGFTEGADVPVVPLCDACGQDAEPTCEAIWEKIADDRAKVPA